MISELIKYDSPTINGHIYSKELLIKIADRINFLKPYIYYNDSNELFNKTYTDICAKVNSAYIDENKKCLCIDFEICFGNIPLLR